MLYLKLPLNYVDPETKAPLPDAILVVSDATFSLRGGSDVLQLSVYATADAAAAGGRPISERSSALSMEEIAAQLPALLRACYEVLLQRPELAGASLVS